MSESGRALSIERMREGGVPDLAIATFVRLYGELEAGATGLIPEADIEPLTGIDRQADLEIGGAEAAEAMARTVVIKLNGGLGTSMGLEAAKSLLPVRDGASFLDLIARQVLAAREAYGARLPLVLMNSFRTQEDSLAALAAHPELAVDGIPADFLQNREPKLDAETLEPVSWPANPDLEWCPPGHGDLYTALQTSGMLQTLLDAGFRYATVSNADNLGAVPDAEIAAWFAASGAPTPPSSSPRPTPTSRAASSSCAAATARSSSARRRRSSRASSTSPTTATSTRSFTPTTCGSTSSSSRGCWRSTTA
ncbi:hypothetical protein GCM10025875_12340 [Litorihabitans aurantiacus]|uniref:UTP--glucose-1-phosphate uridylyltransferase n=1 Tax=Litorihabitans aurantiacus TaxID=1930061 RepID=A0AA37UVS2_9MICO|nr:hypothetical protein GCM10025875_12340 [Litorihabitans aurantiacus]